MALDALCRVPQQPEPYVRCQRCMSAVLGMQCMLAMPCCGVGICDPSTSSSPLLAGQRVGVARRSGQDRLPPHSTLRRNPGQIARLLPVSTGSMLQHARPEWNAGSAQKPSMGALYS